MILAVTFWHWLTQLYHPWNGLGYNVWSGLGSDFGEVTILGAVLAWWKHRNCQVKGCPFIHLSHPTDGGHYVCKLHHPRHKGNRLDHQDILDAHEAAQE